MPRRLERKASKADHGPSRAAATVCTLTPKGISFMLIPRAMTRLNRAVINPVVSQFAGRFGPLALVAHRGRTTGKEYRTPTLAFPAEEGFVIALVYGRNTDWEQNVVNNDGCVLVYHDHRRSLTNPRLIAFDEANAWLPAPIRLGLPLIGVQDFLRLDEATQS